MPAGGWDELTVGTETGRVAIEVTEPVLDRYLETMELDLPCYLRPTPPYDVRIAPSDMVPKLAMSELSEAFCNRVLGPNIRAKQGFVFHAPVRLGIVVRAVSRVTEKYQRRGRCFVVLEALFVDPEDRPLVLDRRTQLVLPDNFAMKS